MARAVWLCAALLAVSACQCGPTEEEQREKAYLLIDRAVDRALQLGLTGLHEAVDGGIPAKSEGGDRSGTMTVSGVADPPDAGTRAVHLRVALAGYSDIPEEDGTVTFDSNPASPVKMELLLVDADGGTFTGSFTGQATLSGDFEDQADVVVRISGETDPVAGQPGRIQRTDGTVRIVGRVGVSGGSIPVDSTR